MTQHDDTPASIQLFDETFELQPHPDWGAAPAEDRVELRDNPADDEPQDSAGGYDYRKAEAQYRKERRAEERSRFPLVQPAPVEGRRLFSNKMRITVSAKPEYPKISFLCKDLGLAVGPPALLIGISQSGKTFLAQALGLCVATGKPLLGSLAVARGPVVHVDYEQGGVLSKLRYDRLIRGMNLAPGDLGPNDLELYRESKKLDEKGAEEELRDKLRGKALCIIDSLRASISADKDENASGIRETIDMLGMVSEDTGCTVVILHHQGKGTVADDRFAGRGSSAIFEAAGAAYKLEVSGDHPDSVYRLWQTKTRMGRAQEVRYHLRDIGAHVEQINCTEGIVLVPTDAPIKEAVEDKIVAALRNRVELSAEELAEAVGGRKASVVKAREMLRGDRFVDTRPRASGKGMVYFLTDLGKDYGTSGE